MEPNLQQEARAKKIHQEATVFDAHCDTILEVLSGKRTLGEYSKTGHLDIPRMKEGGIDVQVFSVFVKPEWYYDATRWTLKGIATLKKQIKENADDICFARTVEEIENAKKTDKLSAFLSIEGGEALQGELDMLDIYHELGVTSLVLTWNNRNLIADGAKDIRSGGGLSNFGKDVVKRMEKLGMAIDLAHIAPKAFWDVYELSTKPFIVSHTLPRKFIDIPRNLDDDQIKAIAEKRGVIGVTFYFKSFSDMDASVENVVDAIDYIVDMVGPDYVGIGSDFDGYKKDIKGMSSCIDYINITRGLVARGYSDEDIKKIMGGNFLRVYKEIIGN